MVTSTNDFAGDRAVVLRLQYLKYQIRGSTLHPYFLNFPQDQALPQRLIDYIETHLGEPRGRIDLDTPLTWAPDNRVVRALLTTLFTRFYSFLPRLLTDLVDDSQLTELRRHGIDSLEDFRLWFWQYVQIHYDGFYPRTKRVQVFNEVAQILKLTPEVVNQLLTAHRDDQMLLQRNHSIPSAKSTIGGYNYEVLETLLYNSDSLALLISGTSLGATARALLKYTKRYGVLVDLGSTDSRLRATIAGPRVFFGRATSFGWNLSQVISGLLQDAPTLAIQLDSISIDVILRDRHYVVELDSTTLPVLIPSQPVRPPEAFLDSKVERQFYWSWHNNKFRGWDIIREPEAFIFGPTLIIPDFALVKGENRVLIEIIGYWRDEYTQKKQAQLELLKQHGLRQMILLVDAKHRKAFTKSPFPIVFYRSRAKRYEIPYGKILKELPS
jgi:predicted nuclease of restriction endonuclease-like RecB superfamily